ncbi:MAG TPA: sigma-54 dependent transcriptional regulator [Candidatus Brocadiia bacterium]|nr:sigma-54 dependent transcriptional regulator [Candidatus Brocadiia bacterium]
MSVAANQAKVLVIDDVGEVRNLLKALLERNGHIPIMAATGHEGLELVRRELPDAALVDNMLPDIKGLDLIKDLQKIDANLPVIIITAYGELRTAVEAVKLGAYDYISKPFDTEDLVLRLQHALRERAMRRELSVLYTQNEESAPLRELMGHSDVVKRIQEQVRIVSATDFTVVILGETGTGKELVARSVHQNSLRRDKPFVPVDCGAIPETLIESELFGYEKGAFTGAERQKKGHFEHAHGGTLFLDEIVNLPLMTQARLLRALQERCIRRVGGNQEIPVDIRVIVAGNKSLEELVKRGKIRPDLYYRLNEYLIELPALRDRSEDIIYLCKRFMDAANHDLGKQIRGFTQDAVDKMLAYRWPGNVRELRNVIRRATLLATEQIGPEHLLLNGDAPVPVNSVEPLEVETARIDEFPPDFSLKDFIKTQTQKIEEHVIRRALDKTGGNKSQAARLLKVDYKTLHSKCKTYGILTEQSETEEGRGE